MGWNPFDRNMNSGYHGYSMSERAYEAYEGGEMPLSKWTKTAILDCMSDAAISEDIIEVAAKMPLKVLKSTVLRYSSWHHTSKMANRTEFYSINSDVTVEQLNEAFDRYKSDKADAGSSDAPCDKLCRVIFGEWEGSRNHPKLVEYNGYAIIRGPWAFTVKDDSSVVLKKKVSGSHFRVEKVFNRAPSGTRGIFERIRKSMR